MEKIIEAYLESKQATYTVMGTGLKLNADPMGDDAVYLDDIKILKDGKEITDFGKKFRGSFNAEDVALSIILGYINVDTTIKDKYVCDELKLFRNKFVCENELLLKENQRPILKLYLSRYNVIPLSYVSESGRTFYTDGDTYYAVDPDGGILTDMESRFDEALWDALEAGNPQYVANAEKHDI